MCKEYGESEYGKFYCFEPHHLLPHRHKPVDAAMLSAEERAWLNEFHANVRKTLAPHLTDEENAWLADACAPV